MLHCIGRSQECGSLPSISDTFRKAASGRVPRIYLCRLFLYKGSADKVVLTEPVIAKAPLRVQDSGFRD